MARLLAAVLAGAAGAGGLAACTGSPDAGSGTGPDRPAVAARPRVGAPGGGRHRLALVPADRVYAARLAVARGWDPCRLHDVAAAERVTGVGLTRPVPSSEYGCTVRTDSGALHAWWRLSVVVGERLTGRVRAQYRRRTVGGVPVLQGGRGPACTVLLPVGALGIRLTAVWEAPWALRPVPRPCAVAVRYARAVLPAWRDPPAREVGARQLRLAGKDPCAAIPELFGAAAYDPSQTRVSLRGPAGCAAVTPRTGHHVGVDFGLRPWPPPVRGRRFVLGGLPAVAAVAGADGAAAGDCTVTVRVGPAPRPRGEGSSLMRRSSEVVAVRSDGGCDQARRQASVVLQAALS